MIEEITPIISNVGFPIAAFMMMWRFSTGALKENTAAIERLIQTLQNILLK